MGNLETPITWVLGIAFIVYIGLGNCCTDSGNQAAFSATNPSLNAPALEAEQAPPPVEITIEDSDTTVVVDTELIIEEEE
jgi:hypothetical protein